MKLDPIMTIYLTSAFLFFCPLSIQAQDNKPIRLLAPKFDGGKSLIQALRERKSSREFSGKELSLQSISDLLWAANGINRPDSGHKTAPSAMNMQEIDIYLAKADGLYLFDARQNILLPIAGEDIRALTGQQPFVKEAPLNLIYVADMGKTSGKDADFYAGTDTGFISENVYLYCASAGLATVVRGLIDKPVLAKAMKLRPNQKIILAQTVGYPKQ
ncbi:MAG: SagB/ThcOx family dehydrogenase [bacterium]|nr:SagB/ThcOx family dehydrogenase [bacterium]